ncbi:MAG: ATP-grasp domain-containing protein [Anaerolineae bacterium]|nr:ATP-grasp domain-containing protein [Anaerolineae bacterium]
MRAFQESWSKRQLPGRLLGADSDPQAGALQVLTESFALPGFDDAACLGQLQALCKEQRVTAILPLTNKAVEFVDGHRGKLKNWIPYFPSAETVAVCHDKLKLAGRFAEGTLRVPETWLPDALPEEVPYPLIVKPRTGEGSKNVFHVDGADDLTYYKNKFTGHVFQRRVEGPEFSIDWFADREGRPRLVSPRERLVVRGGEVMKSRIRPEPVVIDAARKAGAELGLIGPATIQGMLDADGSFWLTDVNLRFGSGYIHSILAGADLPAFIHADLGGYAEEGETLSACEDSVMVRYPGQLLL